MICRRIILLVVIILSVVIICGSSLATNYYVDSSNGNDLNPGTSPVAAWQSIYKVNNSLFLPGDSIFFKRNESWREQLIVPSSGEQGNPIVFGAYGEGEKPLFLGSVAQNNTSDWSNMGDNNWATAVGSFPKINWRSVGFLLMGEETQENVGTLVEDVSDLDMEGEFWWEEANERVILYSPQGNPALAYGTVEVAHLHSCFLLENKEHIVIQDLAFKYSNNSAIMPYECNHIIIQNINASYLGGGKGTTTRAGDAIPPHGESSHILIRGCNISQVFDIGIAPQLYPSETVIMHDIIVENCIIDRCGAGITVAVHGAVAAEIYNIFFRNNLVTNSGYGWSGTNNSVHGKGIGIKEKHGDVKPDVHDVYIENNIVDTYAFRGINAYEGNFNITRNIIKKGTAEYIDGTLDLPGAIALNGGDYVAGDSPGEATGLVAYNLIYDNDCHGIFIKHNTPYPSEPLEIYNNTLINNGDTSYACLKSITSGGTIIKNNIIYSENQVFIETGPFGDGTTTLSNNLYHSLSGGKWLWDGLEYYDLGNYQTASGQDNFSISKDPLLIDPYTSNFHLSEQSPAIDAGVDVGLNYDFDSLNVPLGPAPDIGAFEYDITSGVNEFCFDTHNRTASIHLRVYPNPSQGICTIQTNNNSSSGSTEYQLGIYNIYGVLVEKLTAEDNVFIWNNSYVKGGIYILKLDGEVITSGQRMIVVQ